MDQDKPGTGDTSSEVATPAVTADAPADDPWASFDRWGSRLLVALALLTAVVGLLVVGPFVVSALPPLFLAAAVAFLVSGVALQYVVAVALGRRWAWARLAAVWLLVAIALTGFLGAAADLTASRITIPLAAIAAVLVLLRKPGPLPSIGGRDRRTGTVIGVAFLVTALLPGITTFAVTNRASPLAASADDLELELHLDCPPRGAGMPDRVEATATWRWLRRDLFAGKPDTIGIGWQGSEGADWSRSLVTDGAASSGETIQPGGSGVSMGVVDAALGGLSSWTWAVSPADGRLPDGSATLALDSSTIDLAARPTDGIVSVTALYAHGDRWTVTRDEVCRW